MRCNTYDASWSNPPHHPTHLWLIWKKIWSLSMIYRVLHTMPLPSTFLHLFPRTSSSPAHAFPPSLKVPGTASLLLCCSWSLSLDCFFCRIFTSPARLSPLGLLCSGPLSTRAPLTILLKTAPCPALPHPPRMLTPWVEGLLSVLFGLYPQCSE